MAEVFAVHAVGHSIASFLRSTYPQEIAGQRMPACGFELISGVRLAGAIADDTHITLWLYRVTVNESLTNRPPTPVAAPAPLALDLHYLLTAWSLDPRDEQVTLAWAMRQLHLHPVLDANTLSPDGGWAGDDVIQVVLADLTTEELMHIWSALGPPYRLSVGYVARVLQIDAE